MEKKIAFASDHAGFDMKIKLIQFLKDKYYFVKDFGCFSNKSSDYPDFAHPLALSIEKGEYSLGISLCGSGNGINMTVNKHQNIRSALCWNPEIAYWARFHNDANICALPARFLNFELARQIIEKFLETPFEGGRHIKRVEKIPFI